MILHKQHSDAFDDAISFDAKGEEFHPGLAMLRPRLTDRHGFRHSLRSRKVQETKNEVLRSPIGCSQGC